MGENIGRRGGTWYYRLELPIGLDGRRHQKRVGGFRTEREAKLACAEAQVDVSRGRLRHTPAKTFGELAAEWLAVIGPNRKATTRANYEMLVNTYLVPRLGGARLDRITAPRIQVLYGELRSSGGRKGRPLSGTQVANIHRVLHNVLGYAERMGYVPANPAQRVERPREDTTEREVYSPEQVRTLLEAVRGDRLYALWHLAVATGLRRSELAGLRWSDLALDQDPPLLHVRVARTMAGRTVVESDPKTRAGRRTLVLDESTRRALIEHRANCENERRSLGSNGLPTHVFVDEFGEPFRPDRLVELLHVIQRGSGLPEITLHDLRHTAATVALIAGVHPKVVAERHGHASVQITLDRYSHVLEPMQVAAAHAIGEILSPSDAGARAD